MKKLTSFSLFLPLSLLPFAAVISCGNNINSENNNNVENPDQKPGGPNQPDLKPEDVKAPLEAKSFFNGNTRLVQLIDKNQVNDEIKAKIDENNKKLHGEMLPLSQHVTNFLNGNAINFEYYGFVRELQDEDIRFFIDGKYEPKPSLDGATSIDGEGVMEIKINKINNGGNYEIELAENDPSKRVDITVRLTFSHQAIHSSINDKMFEQLQSFCKGEKIDFKYFPLLKELESKWTTITLIEKNA